MEDNNLVKSNKRAKNSRGTVKLAPPGIRIITNNQPTGQMANRTIKPLSL